MFISDSYLLTQLSLPISLPLTRLKQGDWLTLSTVKLQANMSLTYRFLQLYVVEKLINDGATEPTLVTAGLGLCYVAIIANFGGLEDPSALSKAGTADDVVFVADVGLGERDLGKDALVLTDAGTYSFVVVNNTSNTDIRATVVGTTTLSTTG